jgi:hypothetical protein
MDKLLRNALRKDRANTPHAPSSDAGLRKSARVAELRHSGDRGIGDPDPDRKVEIGQVETELGRVNVTHSQDSISIHGVNTALSEIDSSLRNAIVSASASFSAAENEQEQSSAKLLVGLVIDAVLRRHQFLTSKVREQKFKERWQV